MIYKGNSFKDLWDLTDEERSFYLGFAEWWNAEINKKLNKK